jgi:glycerate kinase
MRILIAPDKFKGSLFATDAADCIAGGLRRAIPGVSLDLCPIADGGEGTVNAMLAACGGKLIHRRVTGPLPEMKVDAAFALLNDGTAVIEMSAASGLALVPEPERNPLNTTTFGTGELIAAAIAEGAKSILLGLGGSATNDAGIGAAQACGFTVLMRDGEPTSMTEPLCGRDLPRVLMVKHGRGEVTAGVPITAAVDVNNPLCGPCGASRVFGPQKGADAATVEILDSQLAAFVARTNSQSSADRPGAGAAGGMGFAVLSFFNGKIANGFELIAGKSGLSDRLAGVDLCITAEGRLDEQTQHGKAVAGVAGLCKRQSVPCVALVGSSQGRIESLYEAGLTAHFCICDGPLPLAVAMRDAKRLLEQTAFNCGRLWSAAVCNRRAPGGDPNAGAV